MAAVDSFSLLYREIARSCNCYVETFALVGAFYTASKAVTLMKGCYSLIRLHFIPRLVSTKDLVHRYGKWAIISGASGAIAKAYAEELARHGVCIVLITTDATGLNDTLRVISDTHKVEVVLLEADFRHGALTCDSIKDAIKDKEVGFVINCLNFPLEKRSRGFHQISEDELWRIMNNGVSAATLITRLALPGMAERRRGVVVNISAGGCFRPCAQRATLFASSAFFDHLSRALRYEYGHRGVFVQSLLPGNVSEGDDGGFLAGWLAPKPNVYARHALSTLGVSHRTTGYWPHTLQLGLVRCLPEWIWVLGSRVTCGTT